MLSSARRTALLALALLAAGTLGGGRTATAQDPPGRAVIVVRVLDPAGEPLGGAAVEVSGTLLRTRSALDGTAALDLSPGTWVVRARLIGSRADSAHVRAPDDASATVVVVLAPAPYTLNGIVVEADQSPPFAQTITEQTIRQVPPLVEADVFRAAVLLPGVSQPNDLKGRIHLAGGASDETGITLDGHPLQDPFHLLGVLGAFDVAALERADVHIHDLPAWTGGRLSGLIALQSREGSAPATDLGASVLAAGATTVQPRLPLGADLLVSGRVTYLDRMIEASSSDRELAEGVPLYGFRDGLLRVGRSWSGGVRAELLGFATRDVIDNSVTREIDGVTPFTWGERLLGLRLLRTSATASWTVRASLGHAGVEYDERPIDGISFTDSDRELRTFSAELTRGGEERRITAGAEWQERRIRQRWASPYQFSTIFSPHAPESFDGAEEQRRTSGFVEAEQRLSPTTTAALRFRLWSVDGQLHPEPAARVTWSRADWRLVAALGRRHQFEAELEEPREGNIAPPLFVLAAPRIADVAAVSIAPPAMMPWGGTRATVELQAFAKHYRNRTVLADTALTYPSSAPVPSFDRVPGHSVGLALSARLASPSGMAAQASYTFEQVRERLAGEWSPPAWESPHILSLFGSVPVGRGWSLNAVYQAHSGAAVTPIAARVFEPSFGGEASPSRFLPGARNSARLEPYRRLDLSARKQWDGWGASWAFSIQVLNALARENPREANWLGLLCAQSGPADQCFPSGQIESLPILPSLGLEIRW